MASASELISNTGNANLGFATGSSVPVTSTGNMDVINKTARDLMLMNHENNLELFKQKVKDRDALYGVLLEGKGSTGAMRDEDRQIYNDAKSDANKAFLELAKSGGVNNPEAMKKYKEKTDYLNQVATQAQARYKLLGEEEQAIATETRPAIREDRQKNLEPQKTNFWSNFQPYQKAYDYDVFKMRNKYLGGVLEGETTPPTATTEIQKVVNKDGKITSTNVQKTAPVKGKQPLTGETVIENGLPYNVTPGGKVSWGKILNNAVSDYQENKDFGAEDQRALLNGIEQLPVAQQQEYLGNILRKAQQYNNENGFKPDERGNYPEGAINIDRLRSQFVPRDPNDLKKGFHVAIHPTELAALDALASLDTYKQPDIKTLDKDAAKALDDINKTQELIRHNKANEGIQARKANAYIHKINKDLSDDEKGTVSYWGGIIDSLSPAMENGKPVITALAGNPPKSFRKVGGVIVNDKGKYIPATIEPFKSTGNVKEYWKPKFIDNSTGNEVSYQELKEQMEASKGRKLTDKEATNGIKWLLKNKDTYSLEIQGEGSSVANIESAMQSARLINNATKKKGQEGVMEETEIEGVTY